MPQAETDGPNINGQTKNGIDRILKIMILHYSGIIQIGNLRHTIQQNHCRPQWINLIYWPHCQ